MNHKDILDNWIGFICGSAGGSIHLMLLANFNLLGLLSAITTAFFCGLFGIAGRHFFGYLAKQWKKMNKKSPR